MKLQLILLLLQSISAQVLHRTMQITACSDSDKEGMVGADGEVGFYADFDKQQEVYTLPDFGDPIECQGCYDAAVKEQATCQQLLQEVREATKDIPLLLYAPGAPLLYLKDHLRHSHHNTLVCQASGFYPAPVHFYWTKDGLDVSHNISVSQAHPQSDGTFTQFSRLDLVPEEGQVYSCGLEHPALKSERKTRIWTVQFQGPSLVPTVFCAVGLSLGLAGVAVGTYFLVKGHEFR